MLQKPMDVINTFYQSQKGFIYLFAQITQQNTGYCH